MMAKRWRTAPRTLVRLPGHLRRSGSEALERRRQRRRMQSFYTAFVRPGGLVFDIGANVGNRVEIFLDLGARVVAVEPQAHCVDVLRSRWPGQPRLKVIAKAVGPVVGRASMYVGEADTLTTLSSRWTEATRASGRFSAYHCEETQEVDVTTLDRMIDEFGVPAFCKIDVEGFEPEVLAGPTRPLPSV
jgi:FkbM family methyltransferase